MKNGEQKISEKLNCIRNEMTHLWGSVFLILGGSVSMVFYNRSLLAYMIGGFGVFIAAMLAYAYFIRRDETLRIINKIEDN